MVAAFSNSLSANNLSIGSSSVVAQNMVNQSVNIQFDVSWDNSWRTSANPNNWDAVWLFVKYKKANDGKWYHATLNANDASHFTGSQGAGAIIDARGDGKGAFFYRSADGTGTFASNQVKLNWNYGSDGIGNNLATELTELQVFGIEMCYIPQGAFYVGSGGTEANHFYTYGGNSPYQITSDAAITIDTTIGNLYYEPEVDAGDGLGPIPAAFPKGYDAIYCMKYEITQEQYANFLNTLNTNQQDERFPNQFSTFRHSIKLVNGVYGCDANNNEILNEAADGQTIACNCLSWADGTAYSDWCGLRPMTELELEKVSRGIAPPVANEYAWGSTIITSAGSGIANIINPGEITEASNISGANCNYYDISLLRGMLRVGSFAGGSRQSSGASYYGVMEMSGNVWEHCVTVGNPSGRAFTGTVGDGVLDANGNANIANCPGITAEGSGFRAGGWGVRNTACMVSDRGGAAFAFPGRNSVTGFRCVSGL